MENVGNIQINFRKNPFRGIISEIAKSEGVSRVSIHISIKQKNPRILTLVADKINQRKKIMSDYETAVAI